MSTKAKELLIDRMCHGGTVPLEFNKYAFLKCFDTASRKFHPGWSTRLPTEDIWLNAYPNKARLIETEHWLHDNVEVIKSVYNCFSCNANNFQIIVAPFCTTADNAPAAESLPYLQVNYRYLIEYHRVFQPRRDIMHLAEMTISLATFYYRMYRTLAHNDMLPDGWVKPNSTAISIANPRYDTSVKEEPFFDFIL